QNQTEGRGCPGRVRAQFDDLGGEAAGRTGSNQPKPWAGRRQTAQSIPRGCQSRRRSSAVMGVGQAMAHAALPMAASGAASAAPKTRERMAARLKEKVMSAEAW